MGYELDFSDARDLSNDENSWSDWFNSLSNQEQRDLADKLKSAPRVGPQPGPQTRAFNSEAKVVGYGGAAGGGKTGLCAIKALLKHNRTVIFRKDAKQLRQFVDDLVRFVGSDRGLNRGHGVYYFGDKEGHMCEWGGLGDPGSEQAWRGRAHDLMIVDEATEVQENKIRFLMAWNRTHIKGQLCQTLLTFNPPGGPDDPGGGAGRWVMEFFAPWIDERHPNPAKSGEVRYFYRDSKGIECEAEDDNPILVKMGNEDRWVTPQSRTFIFARVEDNKYLGQDYISALEALEEPWRTKYLLGSFSSHVIDHEQQVLPSDWVDEAMDRYRKLERDGELAKYRTRRMSSLGVDVARGGRDWTVLARRHDWFWDDLLVYPGESTPDGETVAALCVKNARDGCAICIDAGGIGASPYDVLAGGYREVHGVRGQETKGLPDLGFNERCRNMRSALWWMLRKVLDPKNKLNAILPDHNRLRKELVSVLYREDLSRFVVERKEDVKKRLGHSTDYADAVIYSLYNSNDTEGSDIIYSRGNMILDLDDNEERDGSWMSN